MNPLKNINGFIADNSSQTLASYEQELKTYFVARLKKIRIEKKLSQRKLAEIMGVKQPEIARWEKGETAPTLNALLKFCRAVNGRLEIIY